MAWGDDDYRFGDRPAYRPCDTVEEGCKAAPGLGDSYTRATCFACGMPVCTGKNCSRRMKWYHWGARRVCARCQVDA